MQDIEIYKVPEGRQYWLVRASKKGRLYSHFVNEGVIALGHMDEKLGDKVGSSLIERLDIRFFEEVKLLNKYESLVEWAFPKKQKGEKKDPSETTNKNQCKAFVDNMEIGDWVITLVDGLVRFGVITSAAYLSTKVLESNVAAVLPEDSAYLRRDVSWGPTISRNMVTPKLSVPLRARQTVANLDEFAAELNHHVFPMFVLSNQVYISVNITRPEDIPLKSMAALFSEAGEFDNDVKKAGAEPATVKASFFSEGLVWLSVVVNNPYQTLGVLTAGYFFISTVFNGNSLTGARPLHETIKNIRRIPSAFKEELDAKLPSQDTTALRSQDKENNLISLDEYKKRAEPKNTDN